MLLFDFWLTFGKPGQSLVRPSKAVERLWLVSFLDVFLDKQLY